ncbi:MAG TPA: GtrA family protein [Allosphingosinicella sp.]|nr:GtrA family protein [Allosphingosinicella sp.]
MSLFVPARTDSDGAAAGARPAARGRLVRLALFALASGTGLAIDFLLFILLLAGGASPGAANLASGAAAVTFVYFASARRIFAYRGRFLFGLFAAYLAYQAAAVSAASAAVALLAASQLAPLLAKLVILPVTFPMNFFVLARLTAPPPEGRREARA